VGHPPEVPEFDKSGKAWVSWRADHFVLTENRIVQSEVTKTEQRYNTLVQLLQQSYNCGPTPGISAT
jgi:hypothetical protein